MGSENRRTDFVRHKGALTLSSLANALPRFLFRHSNGSSEGDDPYYLGWECVPSHKKLSFLFDEMTFATAEGVATLAAIVECLRVRAGIEVGIEVDTSSDVLAQAAGIERIVTGNWAGALSDQSVVTRGCQIFPAWRIDSGGEADRDYLMARLKDFAREFVEDERMLDQVLVSLDLVAREALLNIFEHAYADGPRWAYGSLSVTPIPGRAQLRGIKHAAPEELDWLEDNQSSGMMVEFAIADYGFSVPFTLWEDFRRNSPQSFRDVARYATGTNAGRLARAELHHRIALWAFHHMSTRKRSEDFASELARYNWRGLSRVLNGASSLDACLVIRSGQARTGYSFKHHQARLLSFAGAIQREFPGTAVIFRFPLVTFRRSRRSVHVHSERAVKVEELVPCEQIPSKALEIDYDARQIIGVVYPFTVLRDDDLPAVLSKVRQFPPGIVFVAMFCYPVQSASLDSLRIFSAAEIEGIPRLVAFWSPDRRILWRFVGAMSERVRSFIEQLEQVGVSYIEDDSPEFNLAVQLLSSYGHIFRFSRNSIRLMHFHSELDRDTSRRALEVAFSQWSKSGQDAWIFEDPSQVYRLPTGRLVRRFLSAFKLLLSSDMLTQALGSRLMQILNEDKEPSASPIVIVAHSEASYFVARMLLRNRQLRENIYVRKLPSEVPLNAKVYVFADAIYRGETLGVLLKSIPLVVKKVVCVLSLRAEHSVFERDSILAFLRFPFDPHEIDDPASLGSGVRELEVDAVTHIPEEGAGNERIRLGTSWERDEFVENARDALVYGVHWSNARVHIVSLSVAKLIDSYEGYILRWLSEVVERFIVDNWEYAGARDLVVFTRFEASVVRVVPKLCKMLKEMGQGRVGRIFSVVIPFAPAQPREVFGRASGDLLTGIAEASLDRLQFTFGINLPGNFVALFLDDHCITGNNLRNFVIRAMASRLDQTPASIVAIPIVSRLGPGEEFFLSSVCTRLTSPLDQAVQAPFQFESLFRLQVKSADALSSTATYSFITHCSRKSKVMNERMRRYLDEVKSRLEKESDSSLDMVLRHPFYRGTPRSVHPVSSRIVRIRHLIALHQQNVGVLGELLREGLKAFGESNLDLLTLFALEPALLEIPALQKAWRQDLAVLAAECLKTSQRAELKSDALTVLLLSEENPFNELLPFICTSEDLIDQLFIISIAIYPDHSRWTDNLLSGLQRFEDSIPAAYRAYLLACSMSFARLAERVSVLSDDDAQAAVERFVGELAFHGKSLHPIIAIADWISRRERDRSSVAAEEVREKVLNAVRVMQDVVLPAAEGLAWLSKVRGEVGIGTVLDDAVVDLVHTLNFLREYAGTIETGSVGPLAAGQIEDLWSNIRERTFKTSPDIFLRAIRRDEPGGALESAMQAMFSSPVDIVRDLIPTQLPGAKVRADWERRDTSQSLVLCPYSVDKIIEICRLLLQDMAQHGEIGSGEVDFSLLGAGGLPALRAVFSNRTRSGDVMRGGKSQARVKRLAEELGILMSLDEPRSAGQDYKVLVQFGLARYIRCG